MRHDGCFRFLSVCGVLFCAAAFRVSAAAHWRFEGDVRDSAGGRHDVAAEGRTFVAGVEAGGQALVAQPVLRVSASPDFQLAPGLRIACAVRFDEVPSGITPLVVKSGEYQLRVNPQTEDGRLAFFVNLGSWEPRVCAGPHVEAGVWYKVTAHWDGLALTLEVNGEKARVLRSGVAKPGDAPLTVGPFKGAIDELRIENPKLPALQVREIETASVLLRAGRTERVSATVRNFGSDAKAVSATLEVSAGATCAAPVQEIGALPSGASQRLTWEVSAGREVTAAATFKVSAEGVAPVAERRALAFFAEQDEAPVWPVAAGAGAATFYVDGIGGDNANDGASPATAWRDFTPVNGRTLGPGERLLIRRGSVINQELTLSAAGRADAWAEVGAYGEGPRPVIRRNWDIADRCALITNPDYLRVSGLVFSHAAKGLVVCYTKNGHRGLRIEDCIAHHIEGLYRPNSHGIPEWRDRAGPEGDGGLRSSAGIAVVGAAAEGVCIRDCEMFQCSWGFFVKGDGAVIDRVFCHDNHVLNTSPHPALVAVRRSYLQNSIFDASGWHAYAGTMGIMLVDPVGLVIRNCFFLNQPDSGSHDQGGVDFENQGQGCLIDRCTFRDNAGAAVEVLGLSVPQPRNVEIARSRFIRNNAANKLGPSEIFIWGKTPNPEVCCSTGIIRDNGYTLRPGVSFFINEAPQTTRWALSNNTEYATEEALRAAMPFNEPPEVATGSEIWTERAEVALRAAVKDDGRPSGRLRVAWEVVYGPGPVGFADAGAAETTATFAVPGDYLLRLVADDGELWRSGLLAVHRLPAGAAVVRAWAFDVPLDKQGWSAGALGTRVMEWKEQTWPCVSHPVDYVAGGFYLVSMEESADAHLLSADGLGVRLEGHPTVAVRFQNHTPATRMRLRFVTEDAPEWQEAQGRFFDVVAKDTGPRTYTVDMAGVRGWTGTLKRLRLDFATGEPLTGTCRIDYLWVGRLPRD